MTTPQITQCPKCEAAGRQYGELVSFGPTKFRARGFLGFLYAKHVLAMACLKCGHIELILEETQRVRPGSGPTEER